jgi:hypothetical protein
MIFLAISDRAAALSLCGQLSSMLLAFVIGRWLLNQRAVILLVACLGAAGAMVAHILVDGQGAFILMIYAPIIYCAAIVGRHGLDQPRRDRKGQKKL